MGSCRYGQVAPAAAIQTLRRWSAVSSCATTLLGHAMRMGSCRAGGWWTWGQVTGSSSTITPYGMMVPRTSSAIGCWRWAVHGHSTCPCPRPGLGHCVTCAASSICAGIQCARCRLGTGCMMGHVCSALPVPGCAPLPPAQLLETCSAACAVRLQYACSQGILPGLAVAVLAVSSKPWPALCGRQRPACKHFRDLWCAILVDRHHLPAP